MIIGTFVLIWPLLYAKIQQNVEILGLTKISTIGFFFCNLFNTTQHPTIWRIEAIMMDEKTKVSTLIARLLILRTMLLEDDAFEDDAFEAFQRKKPGI